MLTRTKLIVFSIIGVVAFLLALIAAYFVLFGGDGGEERVRPPSAKAQIDLEIWGLFDDSDIFEPILSAYHQAHPQVSVRYKKFTWDDYESTLINALASGRGPDIFIIHNTWLAKHKDKLAPAPRSIDYPFLDTDFKEKNTIYAFPLFIDNLALFYNKDLFFQEGFFEPPKTWEQFIEYTKALTRFSPSGALLRSGVALGTNSRRINRASDILLLFMLQNGIEPFEEGKISWKDNTKKFEASKDALRFYTDFANPSKNVYSWNEDQHYSIDAFWEGSLAMMFNYAYNIETIRQKAPYLNFGVAPLPQKGRPVTIGNYWGFAVSKQSGYKNEAWDFLSFFAQDNSYKDYITQTGRLPAKRLLLERFRDEALYKAFVEQAVFMKTPYQPDEKKVQEILDEVIQNINRGNLTYDQALRLAQDRLQLLIQ